MAPVQEADQADQREDQADGLGEPRRRGVLELAGGASRGRTSVRNSQAYGVRWTPEAGADREQHGLDGQQRDRDRAAARAAARPRARPR